MLKKTGFVSLVVLDKKQSSFFNYYSEKNHELLLKNIVDKVTNHNERFQQTLDQQWSFFWAYPKSIIIALPINGDDAYNQHDGMVAAVVKLNLLHLFWGNKGKAVLFYILINTTILTAAGLYRIFRIYLKPIDRIVSQADGYTEDEDPFFAFRREDNELHRLSSSLNRMLKRIADDKRKLKKTVASLEQANDDLKQAQTEVLRAEKMASIGRLAAGIAHEIGNPIGIVLGYLDLLKADKLNDDDKKDFIDRAEKETQRINTIIRQLLDLARPKETNLQAISIHLFLKDIVAVMMQQPLLKDIEIKLQCNADMDCVKANEEQMRQILINLILNSADAIHALDNSTPGIIVITTSLQEAEHGDLSRHHVISVMDNGIGISPTDLPTIFDPFFTTKEPGKGTGLGLSVSYMITEQMGGTISAESDFGKGTDIRIRLPLCEDENDDKANFDESVTKQA